MKFEFDPEKSRQNKDKHGIDFMEVQKLWKSPHIEFAARQDYENRFAVIGIIDGKLYTCIYTLRHNRIRLISCRRSRQNEVKLYETETKQTEK